MRVSKENLRQIVREAAKDRLRQLDESVGGATNDSEMVVAALQRLKRAISNGNLEAAQQAWRQANFYMLSVKRQLEDV
jgi:hypothetical protein